MVAATSSRSNDKNNNNADDRDSEDGNQGALARTSSVRELDGGNASKQTFTVHSSVDPYKPDGLREVVNVGVQQQVSKVKYAIYQFSPDYIIATELINIDLGNGSKTSYDGWAIRKVKYGQDPNGEVVDRKGVSKLPFSFTGRVHTLAELQRALCLAERDCVPNDKEFTLARASEIQPNMYGVVDISAANEPEYPQLVTL